jgi:hypothetical protein
MTGADVIAAEAFAKRQREKLARNFKLVDETTGEPIALPATRKCWDGYEITIKDFQASGSKDMPGKIYTTMNEVFAPSVCGAKIIEFPAGELDRLVGAGMPI